MNSPLRTSRWFTLIELLIVITIIGILSIGSFVPYDYYSRVSRVRISVEKVHQTLEDARILSQNGQIFPGTTKNANIWLLFEKNSPMITMFAFSGTTHSFTGDTNTKIIKVIQLETGINITSLPANILLLEFTAPKGAMEIYKTTGTGANFDMGIGWKTATTGALYRTLKIEK